MSRAPQLRTLGGQPIALGRKLGEGGEGAVFDIPSKENVVAKVYHSPVDAKKASKLGAMARGATPALLKIAAWPFDVLAAPDGRVHGFLMPKVANAREAHSVYSPKQRRNHLPHADWKFLIWVARNAAAAVSTVHAAGHIIGDINQKGFLVDERAQVQLIDCDSFQILAGTERHYCLVGVPEFTAPELIGKPFERTLRTENHDGFGLSVLIFHLLFMGRHPFAGRYHGPGDMPVERSVRELRFAYSQSASSFQMTPPPHALALSATSFGVASLFERAFGSVGVQGARPRAIEWVTALERLAQELKVCDADKIHKFHNSLRSCPWCDIERKGGPSFFVSPVATSTTGYFDLDTLLKSLTQQTLPARLPSAPSLSQPRVVGRPLPQNAHRRGRIERALYPIAGVVALSSLLGGSGEGLFVAIALATAGLVIRPGELVRVEIARRRRELHDAEQGWRVLLQSWERDGNAALQEYERKRALLQSLADEYRGLGQRRAKELQALERDRERVQKQDFLERFDVETASLSGIGPGIKAQLIAEGFETAADLNPRVLNVSGIGPARYATLMAWRSALESRFRFNPALGVPQQRIAAVEHLIHNRRRELESQLKVAHQEFVHAYRRAQRLVEPDHAAFLTAATRVAQAKADLAN